MQGYCLGQGFRCTDVGDYIYKVDGEHVLVHSLQETPEFKEFQNV